MLVKVTYISWSNNFALHLSRKWKLSAITPHDRHSLRSGVRFALQKASQLTESRGGGGGGGERLVGMLPLYLYIYKKSGDDDDDYLEKYV